MTTRTRMLAALTVLTLALAACGGGDDDTAATTTTATTAPAGTTTAPADTTTVPAGPTAVKVYFTDADARLAVAGREVTASDTARAALDALLAGPQGIEVELGWSSAIPAGTELLGVEVAGPVATVDLSPAFETGGGSASMLARVAQVVYTLTQLPGVERVRFEIAGEPVESIGGEGVVVDGEGAGRDAFEAALPAILVESPTPGAAVTSPVTVSGLANTFEATIRYTVTDPEGLILEEGFHTGGGTADDWGPFEFAVEFDTERSGLGAVIVFESSPEDGSQVNVVEIPVRMS